MLLILFALSFYAYFDHTAMFLSTWSSIWFVFWFRDRDFNKDSNRIYSKSLYELHARFVFPDSKTTTEPRTFWAAGRNWCQEGSVLGGCYQCNPLVTSFHSLEIRYLQLPLHMCQPTSCPLSRHAQDVYWNRMQSSQVSPKHCKKRCSGVFFFLDSMSGEMSSPECISFDCRM